MQKIVVLIIAIAVVLAASSFKTGAAIAQEKGAAAKSAETETHLLWLGRMSLSILWSIYAAILAAIGFARRAAGIRVAALVLFTVTMIKVVFLDMAELREFYRIMAFLVLGLVLLAVAWAYQRAFQVKESSK